MPGGAAGLQNQSWGPSGPRRVRLPPFSATSLAHGRNDLHDERTAESFPSDYDQTHTVNAYGLFRSSGRLSFSGRFRYGSNFPLEITVQVTELDVELIRP